jgi:hypothetical protein
MDNQEWTIKNGQSRATGYIVYTRHKMKTHKKKIKHNTICVGHHYMQTNTNNVKKTWTILQTTGGKDEPNIFLCGNHSGRTSQHGTQNVKPFDRTKY